MKKLEIPDGVKEEHRKYFEEQVFKKMPVIKDEDIKKDDDTLRKKFWEYCKENWLTLAIGEPSQLRKIGNFLDEKYKSILASEGFKTELKDFWGNKYKKFCREPEEEWNAYKFTKGMGLRTCPYCNQNYTLVIMKKEERDGEEEKIYRPNIDHFYPQNQYPYFSLSLYNMVPCCEMCNLRLKGAQEVEIEFPNPYEFDMDEEFHFEFLFDGNVTMSMVSSDSNEKSKFNQYNKMLHLKALYDEHQDYARKIYDRFQKYGRGYFDSLQNLLSKEVSDKEKSNKEEETSKKVVFSEAEMRDLRWSQIPTKDEILDEPFGKMRKDLIGQLEDL